MQRHTLRARKTCTERARSIPMAAHLRVSSVVTSGHVWYLSSNKGAPVPPHERRLTTDGREAPWWRPWARWRPVAHDRCICNECGELVACERMADMRMRICRDCAGGGDLCRLCGAPPPECESWPPLPGPTARSCRKCWDSTMDRVSCNVWVRLRMSM